MFRSIARTYFRYIRWALTHNVFVALILLTLAPWIVLLNFLTLLTFSMLPPDIAWLIVIAVVFFSVIPFAPAMWVALVLMYCNQTASPFFSLDLRNWSKSANQILSAHRDGQKLIALLDRHQPA